MKFTKYFAAVIKNDGIPHVNVDAYQKLFNIVSSENRLDELYKLRDKERSNDRKYSLEIRIFVLKEKLDRLTMENTPKNLLKYMLNESRFEH